jgi:hypothetical protein
MLFRSPEIYIYFLRRSSPEIDSIDEHGLILVAVRLQRKSFDLDEIFLTLACTFIYHVYTVLFARTDGMQKEIDQMVRIC